MKVTFWVLKPCFCTIFRWKPRICEYFLSTHLKRRTHSRSLCIRDSINFLLRIFDFRLSNRLSNQSNDLLSVMLSSFSWSKSFTRRGVECGTWIGEDFSITDYSDLELRKCNLKKLFFRRSSEPENEKKVCHFELVGRRALTNCSPETAHHTNISQFLTHFGFSSSSFLLF